ncbi:hypothetical protein BGZ74_005276, partial [Mortierella antarctica]
DAGSRKRSRGGDDDGIFNGLMSDPKKRRAGGKKGPKTAFDRSKRNIARNRK